MSPKKRGESPIDSGIGLTAGKKLCGKAIAQSDDTYLTTVNLRQKFIQLKRFQSIKEQPTYQPTLYIESPYKQQSEEYEQQLEEQLTINGNTTAMMYLFVTTTIVFATVAVFLFVLNRKTRLIT